MRLYCPNCLLRNTTMSTNAAPGSPPRYNEIDMKQPPFTEKVSGANSAPVRPALCSETSTPQQRDSPGLEDATSGTTTPANKHSPTISGSSATFTGSPPALGGTPPAIPGLAPPQPRMAEAAGGAPLNGTSCGWAPTALGHVEGAAYPAGMYMQPTLVVPSNANVMPQMQPPSHYDLLNALYYMFEQQAHERTVQSVFQQSSNAEIERLQKENEALVEQMRAMRFNPPPAIPDGIKKKLNDPSKYGICEYCARLDNLQCDEDGEYIAILCNSCCGQLSRNSKCPTCRANNLHVDTLGTYSAVCKSCDQTNHTKSRKKRNKSRGSRGGSSRGGLLGRNGGR